MEAAIADVSDLFFSRWKPFYIKAGLLGPEEQYNCAVAEDNCTLAVSSPETLDWSSTPGGAMPEKAFTAVEDVDDKGLRLVHLLMAAAEALSGNLNSLDLARVILIRLKETLSMGRAAAAASSGMESLAACFTDALHFLLHDVRSVPKHSAAEVTAAFALLQDMLPCVKFGHFTVNQAILEAVAGERRVHIVDYDIMEGVQWASLMQSLVCMNSSPPPLHLRITAVTRFFSGAKRPRPVAEAQEMGRRLAKLAESIGLPFSFRQCRLEQDGRFRLEALKLVRDEAVVFNCAMHAPHQAPHSAASVGSFLHGAAAAGARLITVVEEEVGGGGGGEERGFVWRFTEELLRYSAMWDAMGEVFLMEEKAREMVERVIMAPRIAGAVWRAYRERMKVEGWAAWMEAAGFRRLGLSFFSLWQAKQLLGLFNQGYVLEHDAPNKLTLRWKSRRLLSASVWTAAPPLASGGRLEVGFGS